MAVWQHGIFTFFVAIFFVPKTNFFMPTTELEQCLLKVFEMIKFFNWTHIYHAKADVFATKQMGGNGDLHHSMHKEVRKEIVLYKYLHNNSFVYRNNQ